MSREIDAMNNLAQDVSLDARWLKNRISDVSCTLSTIMNSCHEPALTVLKEYLLKTVEDAMRLENKTNELWNRIDLMNDEMKKGEAHEEGQK